MSTKHAFIPTPTRSVDDLTSEANGIRATIKALEAKADQELEATIATVADLRAQIKALEEQVAAVDEPAYAKHKAVLDKTRTMSSEASQLETQAELATWHKRIPQTDDEFAEVFRIVNRTFSVDRFAEAVEPMLIESGRRKKGQTWEGTNMTVFGSYAGDSEKVTPPIGDRQSMWYEFIRTAPRVDGYVIKGAREVSGSDKEYLAWDAVTKELVGMLLIDGSSHPGDETQATIIVDGEPVKVLRDYSSVKRPIDQFKWALKRRSMGYPIDLPHDTLVKVHVTGTCAMTGYPRDVDFTTTIPFGDFFAHSLEVNAPGSDIEVPLNNARGSRFEYKHTLAEPWA